MSDLNRQIEKLDQSIEDMVEAGVEEWTTEGGKRTRMIPLDQLIKAQDHLERRRNRQRGSIFRVVRRIDG